MVNFLKTNKQTNRKKTKHTEIWIIYFTLHHSYYTVWQSPKVLQQINISSQFCVATKQFKKIKIFKIVRKLYHLSIKRIIKFVALQQLFYWYVCLGKGIEIERLLNEPSKRNCIESSYCISINYCHLSVWRRFIYRFYSKRIYQQVQLKTEIIFH